MDSSLTNSIQYPCDIWRVIKQEWLGLGENWNAGFKKWCKGSLLSSVLYKDTIYKDYSEFVRRQQQRQGFMDSGHHGSPTLALWWNKYKTFWSSNLVKDRFKLPRSTLMGRLHIVYFHWDLQGKNGESAKYKADFKLLVDGKKHWDAIFSQPWFELRLCYLPFAEENNDGPEIG